MNEEKGRSKKPPDIKATKDKDKEKDKKKLDKARRKDGASTKTVARALVDEATREKAISLSEQLKKETTSLKDFQKLRRIGRGAIGMVYLVRHKSTGHLYAMKVIKKFDMIEKNKRVLTEREILASVDHPFIVTLYYSFQSKHSLVFVMQYCAGGEFYRIIQRQPYKCLREADAKFYASEVLLGLEYLHMMGFIYRDLKPENVLMHESGHIKLTDFDLSKGSSAPVQPRVVTKMFSGHHGVVAEPDLVTNSFVGTEEYLAPEVVSKSGHSASVDWWTFGILLYEMLYGTTPFRGVSRAHTFDNIQKTTVQFGEHKRGGVSKECKSLLRHLLVRDPLKRLGTVGGSTDIKDHPFFKDTKWVLLPSQTPPIIPKVTTPQFEELPDEDIEEEVEIDTSRLAADHPFKSFDNIDLTDRDKAERDNKPVDDQDKNKRRREPDETRKDGRERDQSSTSEERRPEKESKKKDRRDRDFDSTSEERRLERDGRRKERARERERDSSSEDDRRLEQRRKDRRDRERDSSSEEIKRDKKKDRKRERKERRDPDKPREESSGEDRLDRTSEIHRHESRKRDKKEDSSDDKEERRERKKDRKKREEDSEHRITKHDSSKRKEKREKDRENSVEDDPKLEKSESNKTREEDGSEDRAMRRDRKRTDKKPKTPDVAD